MDRSISRNNIKAFLWHAGFLALAQNFIDIDTVMPAMLVESGGSAIQVGFLTAIMLGGSSVTQIVFAPFVSNFSFKKKFLLLGINTRILALMSMGIILYFNNIIGDGYRIAFIFILISIFSLSGAFTNISYTDILGKSIQQESRKRYLSIRQIVTGSILLGSVFIARYVLSSHPYPENYAYMFFVGFGALFTASIGFWHIIESEPSKLSVKSPSHFFSLIKKEMKFNKKLGSYLGFINTMGVSISLLPFIILFAKENYNTQSSHTGNFLLFKVTGSVIMGLTLFALARRFKYRNLLYINAAVALLLPLVIMLPSGTPPLSLVFLLGGIVFSIYQVTMNGVLLEVSGTSNRALYTGIAGAGNILPAIFPLAGGWIIKTAGFDLFFMVYMGIIALSFFFIHRLQCKM